MDELAIVRATPADWEKVAALHAASWRSAYRGIYPDRFLDEEVTEDRRSYWRGALPGMTGDRDAVFIAVRGGEPVGFACLRRDHDPAAPLLDNLHALPDRKGGGTGRQLVGQRDMAGRARAGRLAQLFVWAANLPARGFCRHLGAVEAEQRDEPVPGGDIARILRMCWPEARVLLAPPRRA